MCACRPFKHCLRALGLAHRRETLGANVKVLGLVCLFLWQLIHKQAIQNCFSWDVVIFNVKEQNRLQVCHIIVEFLKMSEKNYIV